MSLSDKNYAEHMWDWKRLVLGRDLTVVEQKEFVQKSAQGLIEWLYDPTPESTLGWKLSDRAKSLNGEAINWGDLSVVDVDKTVQGEFIIYIEEADPSCPKFQAWMLEKLTDWGFKIKEVRTEW